VDFFEQGLAAGGFVENVHRSQPTRQGSGFFIPEAVMMMIGM
jgi:hypothetical protein